MGARTHHAGVRYEPERWLEAETAAQTGGLGGEDCQQVTAPKKPGKLTIRIEPP